MSFRIHSSGWLYNDYTTRARLYNVLPIIVITVRDLVSLLLYHRENTTLWPRRRTTCLGTTGSKFSSRSYAYALLLLFRERGKILP